MSNTAGIGILQNRMLHCIGSEGQNTVLQTDGGLHSVKFLRGEHLIVIKQIRPGIGTAVKEGIRRIRDDIRERAAVVHCYTTCIQGLPVSSDFPELDRSILILWLLRCRQKFQISVMIQVSNRIEPGILSVLLLHPADL